MFFEVANNVGVVAFAISGMLKGLKHKLDIFGVIVLGVITAVGGGIVRDVLLGEIPASIRNESDIYLAIIISIISYLFLCNKLEGSKKISRLVMISDALGLAVFAIVGAEKAINFNLGPFSIALMATLTGVGGGVIRDVLVSEIPFILKEDLYAILCLMGGIIYWVLVDQSTLVNEHIAYIVFLLIFIIRLLAIKYKLNLPKKTWSKKYENN